MVRQCDLGPSKSRLLNCSTVLCFTSNVCRVQQLQHLQPLQQVQWQLYTWHAGSTGEKVSSADALFEHLCVTVLQQSHLCPVPLENQSVFWQYDHALHLYPAPDLLILADSAASAQFVFKDTACVNPVLSPSNACCFCCHHWTCGLGCCWWFVE